MMAYTATHFGDTNINQPGIVATSLQQTIADDLNFIIDTHKNVAGPFNSSGGMSFRYGKHENIPGYVERWLHEDTMTQRDLEDLENTLQADKNDPHIKKALERFEVLKQNLASYRGIRANAAMSLEFTP